jgi:hypothetical protein
VSAELVARGVRVPVCWGGCWDSLLAIASPEDSVADYVATCRATGQKPFVDGPHFELSRFCRHDRPIKTAQGIAAIVAAVFATGGRLVEPRPAAPRVLARAGTGSPPDRGCSNHSTGTPGSWCSTRPWWSANPLGMLWPEMDAAFVISGGGGPPAVARRPVLIVAAS